MTSEDVAGAGTAGGRAGIHLFVPMLHRRDAVGEHTRALRDQLLDAGIPSRIYIDMPDPETAGETRPYAQYASDAVPGDVLVYQVATRSAMADWLGTRPEPLVLNYHSITPSQFFGPWHSGIARAQDQAIEEMTRLAPRAVLGVGVSEFDATELRAAGCRATQVVPVANITQASAAPDRAAAEGLALRAASRGPWWLSVGRLAPNKAHQDTIAALFVARSSTDPDAHLTIVGSAPEPNYAAALHRYVADLGLAEVVEFVTGLSAGELAARYAAADVLVMLSEHEGFGVPLVEAMAQGLPVVAYDAGAVGEVMGGAGVLLSAKGPGYVAVEVHRLLSDSARRTAVVDAGRARLGVLGLERAGSDLVTALLGVAESSGRVETA